MHYPCIFNPLEVGTLRLSNRVVIPPMVVRKAAEDGTVTPEILKHYGKLRGAGMVVVEATAVSPEGRLDRKQLGIFDDDHVKGLAALARLIHESGAAASIQIHHAGRNTTTENTFGLALVAPSAFSSKRAEARELTDEEIEWIISRFASAARRAAEAGFNAVEVHSAHGYLASQFLSPLANKRTDRWGGSLENRSRFLRETLSRIRAEVPEMLAYCRLGAADGEPGGLTLDEGLKVARRLQDDGVPLLHVSSGIGNPPVMAPKGGRYSNRFLLGAALKKGLAIPVICVGEIGMPDQAEAALSEGMADLVAVGRGLLVDPEWIIKAKEGRSEEIVACRNCKVCNRFLHPEHCPAARERAA